MYNELENSNHMKRLILLLVILVLTTHSNFGQVNVIFDTDFGGDADDLGALAMLHHLMDRKECDLLAVMCWSTEKYAVSAIDAVNTYYKHPNIPIGVRKSNPTHIDWNYSKPLAAQLPHERTYNNVPDTSVLYRQLLAESADNTIVIITVGPLKNIENLIKSGPDSISPLSGKELMNKKVKEFVIMGGQYPSGKNEWNFDGRMKGTTKFVVNNITVPITFLGYEVGVNIKTGKVFNQLNPKDPLYIGFMHFSRYAPWMKHNFRGEILDNATYDQTAILYAVRKGIGLYWDRVRGICVPDEHGGNEWISDNNAINSYLKLKIDREALEKLIESMMLGKF